jgi:hypothetical protein
VKFHDQLHTRPDGLAFAIKDALIAADESTIDHPDPVATRRADQAHALCRRWFCFGDILTVEIDTDAETCAPPWLPCSATAEPDQATMTH